MSFISRLVCFVLFVGLSLLFGWLVLVFGFKINEQSKMKSFPVSCSAWKELGSYHCVLMRKKPEA